MIQRISPFLWFDDQAEEAAELYVSIFENSRIVSVSRRGEADSGDPAMSVSFELDGLQMQAFNGGPGFRFTEAISLMVRVETQEEIDRVWDRLTDGGEPSRCGWLKDRYGLSWQIVPPVLHELLADPDPERAGRTMMAMLAMTKLDIAALQAAADGTGPAEGTAAQTSG